MHTRLTSLLLLLAPLAAQAAAPALHVFGNRNPQLMSSAASAKLDSALADLSMHLNQVSSQNALSDLHSLSPAARFMQRPTDATPLVLVDAVTRGDAQQLKNALVALGLQKPSVYLNVVSGWLPVNQIEAAVGRAELHSMNAAMSRSRAGAITTQGDFVQHSATLRGTYSLLDGTGITVGALSDSYNCYTTYAANGVPASGQAGYAQNGFLATASSDVTSGDLPSAVTVVSEASCMNYPATQLPFADEGRAMLQIVHDVAPGATLAFHTADNGEADFANGITTLASVQHANVIVDDVGYFDEPFFQDGLVAQAIDTVFAQGVAYFSAAGNDASQAYENPAPGFPIQSSTAPNAGEFLLNFDNSGATKVTSLSVMIPKLRPGELIPLVLQWDQPYVKGAPGSPGATSHMDLCVTGSGADKIINTNGDSATCTGPNATGSDPIRILIISNPANSAGTTDVENISISVGLANGSPPPTRIKLLVGDNGAGAVISSNYATNPTIHGHSSAAGAAAVGASAFYNTPACGTTNVAVLEFFSSRGGDPILFDKTGARLATPVTRQKPDFVAPQRGNNTFFGHALPAGAPTSSVPQCADNTSYPHFAGTSAAAPHAAAVAALLLQANSKLTPSQVYVALQKSALPMGTPSPDFATGYGFIQADAAVTSLAALPPGAPTLQLANSSLAVGASTTLKWMSINTTGCTASGGWSGSQATSGSMTVVAPATAGTTDYTLTCSNAIGSASATATLTATAASQPSGGHGGGAVDQIVLLVLAGLIVVRRPWAPSPPSYLQSCRAKPAGRRQWRSRGTRVPQPPMTESN